MARRRELGGVHLGKALERKGPLVQARAEADLTLDGLERDVAEELVVVRRDDDVHVLDRLDEAAVGLLGGQLELHDAAVQLVEEKNGANALADGLPQHRLRLHADAFDTVDDDEGAVRHTERGGHLRREVNVARGVDQVDKERLLRNLDARLQGMMKTKSRSE